MASSQPATVSRPSGTADGQAGTANGQAGTANGQAGTADGQAGTANGQAGTANGQAGTANGQAGTANGHVDSFKIKTINKSDYLAGQTSKSGDVTMFNGRLHQLSFLGSLDWQPNLEAVQYLIGNWWPVLHRKNPEMRLNIAGKNFPKTLLEKKIAGVVMHGTVPDAKAFLEAHPVVVVPLRTGSGIRIKILEALGLGLPVISTAKGVEGLGLVPELHYLPAETADEFAEQALGLLNRPGRATKLGTAGRMFVSDRFNVERLSRLLNEFYRHLRCL
jgi:hypothetical protein